MSPKMLRLSPRDIRSYVPRVRTRRNKMAKDSLFSRIHSDKIAKYLRHRFYFVFAASELGTPCISVRRVFTNRVTTFTLVTMAAAEQHPLRVAKGSPSEQTFNEKATTVFTRTRIVPRCFYPRTSFIEKFPSLTDPIRATTARRPHTRTHNACTHAQGMLHGRDVRIRANIDSTSLAPERGQDIVHFQGLKHFPLGETRRPPRRWGRRGERKARVHFLGGRRPFRCAPTDRFHV